MKNELHEKEIFILKSSNLFSLKELRKQLKILKFKEIDDFCSLKRKDIIYPWRSINITSVNVYNLNTHIDLIDDDSWVRMHDGTPI